MIAYIPPDGHVMNIPRVPVMALELGYHHRPLRCSCGWETIAYDIWTAVDMADAHLCEVDQPPSFTYWEKGTAHE